MSKDITFLDVETTIKNRGDDAIGKMSGSPHHPDNEIVWVGWKCKNNYSVETHKRTHIAKTLVCLDPNNISMLVGQNIAFDLLHLMNDKEHGERWIEWAQTGGRIWDTMIAEYLLSGQQDKFISLDELSLRYGGTVKDSRMKEYWEQGVCTYDIPDDEIEPYLEEDVLNTEIVFNGQFDKAMELDMLPLLSSQMDARLATIMMEFNGMHFDKMLAYTEKQKLEKQYVGVYVKLATWMASQFGCDPKQVNPTSPKQMSSVLFGTPEVIEFVEKKPMLDDDGSPIYYKSGAKKGQPRLRNEKVEYTAVPYGRPDSSNKIGANGCYSVGDDQLKRSFPKDQLVEDILKLRELNKQINTYFDGYSRLVFPDGCIHGNLNHCQTNTGRLSSSQPNLQNISNKESK